MTVQPFHEAPVPYYQQTDSWVPVLTAVGDLATKLAGTPFVPRAMQRNPAAVAAAILTGREMQLGPMASLRGIDVIEGRPSLTAQMLAARILSAGHSIEWITATDKQCTVRIVRGDGLSTAEATWTITDAQRAGLAGKKVWQQYPRHMLRARALSECASMACPDVALGLDVAADTDTPERPSQPFQVQTVQLPAPAPEPLAEPPTDVVDVPAAEPEPEPPTPDIELITAAQMRKIGAQIGEYERLDGERMNREQRRTFIQRMAGLDKLDSAKDLTKTQAGDVIETLDLAIQAKLDQPAPVTHSDEVEVVDPG